MMTARWDRSSSDARKLRGPWGKRLARGLSIRVTNICVEIFVGGGFDVTAALLPSTDPSHRCLPGIQVLLETDERVPDMGDAAEY